jgi:hypothetical protein
VAAGDVDSGSSCTQAQKIRQKHRLRIQVVRLRGIGNLGAPPRSGICPLSATRGLVCASAEDHWALQTLDQYGLGNGPGPGGVRGINRLGSLGANAAPDPRKSA